MTGQLTLNQTFRLYSLEAQMEILKTFREPAFLLPSLLFPVMFYAFFGVMFNQGGNMPAYLLATYAVFGVIGPGLFSFGVGVATEKQQGWLELKQTSPMPIFAYFFAKVAATIVLSIIILIELMLVAAIFGDVVLSRSQWIFTFIVCLVGTIPFCAMGLWLGLLLKGEAAAAVVNLIYLPMAFLSGLWIPLSILPEVIKTIAWGLPAFHLSQLVLMIQGSDLGHDWWLHSSILLATTLLFFILSLHAFKRISQPA